MEAIKGKFRGMKTSIQSDWNVARATRLVKRGVRGAPYGAARYLSNKIPFFQWVGAYNPRWLLGDMLSGTTVGIVLVLQAVNLAVPGPAGVSVQQALWASWLPGLVYTITGTSKREWFLPSRLLSF